MNNTYIDVYDMLNERIGADPKAKGCRIKLFVMLYDQINEWLANLSDEESGKHIDLWGSPTYYYGSNEISNRTRTALGREGDIYLTDMYVELWHDGTENLRKLQWYITKGIDGFFGPLSDHEKVECLANPDTLVTLANRECKFYEKNKFGAIETYLKQFIQKPDEYNIPSSFTDEERRRFQATQDDFNSIISLVDSHMYEIAKEIDKQALKLVQRKDLIIRPRYDVLKIHPCVMAAENMRYAGSRNFTK